jgi:hypothetical protein
LILTDSPSERVFWEKQRELKENSKSFAKKKDLILRKFQSLPKVVDDDTNLVTTV